MANLNREIQELLADYGVALRDGCLPAFLKSLTREEARAIRESDDFWAATEMVRLMNSAGFGDKVVAPDVGLFISRVDAAIVSRQKRASASTRSPSRNRVNL
ncbi:MAG: hypothetical protein RBR19_12010 [Sedimentisphaerales bacterium]|jgi:hypothetical protein|nr:hypothetical protein [Planctomycetota bacterium]MDY0356599.1 hypothetical protein [Sedimentisphaerales bacterium]NLT76409.1 hypothetical protein [Planctomycetota bacterium]